MKNWIKKNKSHLFIFSIYFLITFIIIFFHEQWRDEAQSWLIARDLSFTELISQLKYEGHFIIWYLILMPFAKLGFPIVTANIISTILVSISVWIILSKSPLKSYQKGLFIFSAPMLYLYPTISRCYAILPLAICLTAYFYKDRKEKPIRYVLAIALLANTHVIMLGMVGILLLEFYLEQFLGIKQNTFEQNKQILKSLLVITILLALSALPIIGSITTNQRVGNVSIFSLELLLKMVIIKPIDLLASLFTELAANTFILVLVVISTLVLITLGIKNSWKRALEFYIILLWQCFIYTYIYAASFQRIASIILIILFFVWTSNYTKQKEKSKIENVLFEICFTVFMILNIINGACLITLDIEGNYSSAKQVADYIKEELPENSIMVVGSEPEFISSIIAHTPNTKYYYIQSEDYFTFATWDKDNIEDLDENFDIQSLKEKLGTENVYYLCPSYKFSDSSNDTDFVNNMVDKEILLPIFTSDQVYYSYEQYIILEIK